MYGGKKNEIIKTCTNAEMVPSIAQYLPICCLLGHLIWCPNRNISIGEKGSQRKTECRSAQVELRAGRIRSKSNEEEEAYLLHLKNLHTNADQR